MNLYNINPNFFKIWTPQMAYILGFYFADGSLSNHTISLEIQKRDKEILKKINKATSSNYPIKETKNGGYVRLRISNPSIISDLEIFGLNINKKLRLFPDIPKEYLNHFLRGFLDGDGWVSLRKNRNEFEVGFVSCNYRFLSTLVNQLNKKTELSINHIRISTKKKKDGGLSKVYSISWYSINAIRVIKFLYDNLNQNDLYLNRKYSRQIMARNIYKNRKYITKADIEDKFRKPIKTILNELIYNHKLKVNQISKIVGVRESIYAWLKTLKIGLLKNNKTLLKECSYCGRLFKIKRFPTRFCSKICCKNSRLTGKLVACISCGKQIYRPAWWFKVNNNPLCSIRCKGLWKKKLLESNTLQRSNDGKFLGYLTQ